MALCSICEHLNRGGDRQGLSHPFRFHAGHSGTVWGFSLSAESHKANHLPRLVQAAEAAEEAQAVTSGAALIDELDRLLERALAILEAAEGSGQLRVALQAIREARETIKACAELAMAAELEARVEALEAQIVEAQRGGVWSV